MAAKRLLANRLADIERENIGVFPFGSRAEFLKEAQQLANRVHKAPARAL